MKTRKAKHKQQYTEAEKAWINWDNQKHYWTDFKKPQTFEEAVNFLDFINVRGECPNWSLQYWGFGEHFTCWSGYGTFSDFNVDNGTAMSWFRLKEIIIKSAQYVYDEIKENRPHLFKKTKEKK